MRAGDEAQYAAFRSGIVQAHMHSLVAGQIAHHRHGGRRDDPGQGGMVLQRNRQVLTPVLRETGAQPRLGLSVLQHVLFLSGVAGILYPARAP